MCTVWAAVAAAAVAQLPRTRFERIAADVRQGRGMHSVELYPVQPASLSPAHEAGTGSPVLRREFGGGD
jgi:hypothetical protein